MNIIIRKATHSDFQNLSPLIIELQANEQRIYPGRSRAEDIVDEYNKILARDFEAGKWQVFVAEIDGKLVGYAAGTEIDPEDDLENVIHGYYIGDLVVLKEYRGQGIGAKLLSAVYEYAKEQGFGCVQLNVLAGNTEAQGFYKAQGFEDYEVVLRKRL